MPLTILVPMILIGLPLVIGLVYLAGSTWKREELTADLTRKLFNLDHPGVDCQKVIVDDARNTALISRDGFLVGLVAAVGNNYLTRQLNNGMIKGFTETRHGIDIRLNDFTLKQVQMEIADLELKNTAIQQLKSVE